MSEEEQARPDPKTGQVTHTYSWDGAWMLDNGDDMAAAKDDYNELRNGGSYNSDLMSTDPAFDAAILQEFLQRQGDPNSAHYNGLVMYNCKTEATNLLNGADGKLRSPPVLPYAPNWINNWVIWLSKKF